MTMQLEFPGSPVWSSVLVSFMLGVALCPSSVVGQGGDPTTDQEQATRTVVDRTILEDGTIEIQYDDGSTQRISPEPEPAGQGATTDTDERGFDEPYLPAQPPSWVSDPDTLQGFHEAFREYYAYRVWGLRHRREVFAWQLYSSRIIFGIVILLVLSGIAFAAIQFYVGMKERLAEATDSRRKDRPSEKSNDDERTELNVSAEGIKVSSPVLGVIILVVSLAFFYLYLVYVHPISEIF